MRILFFTKYDRKGASSRYRTFQYIPHLERKGIQCQVSSLFDERYLNSKYENGKADIAEIYVSFVRRLKRLLTVKHFDLILIETELFPYFPSIFERYLNLINLPYVLDYDDAIFHKYDRSEKAIVKLMFSSKIMKIMRGAALVIAGNPYLAEYSRKIGAKVVEIPTVIDLSKYPLTKPQEPDIFTIGWIGSPATEKYLLEIEPAFRAFSNKGYRFKILLVGATYSLKKKLSYMPVEILSWAEDTEVANIQRFSVGIMPLPDSPWTRGKCGLKLIQYMGSFLPVIASPVGTNKKIVKHGSNGFLAETQNEWLAALEILYKDGNLRNVMGLSGRKVVENEYSLTLQAPRYVEYLTRVVKDN